MFTFYLTFPDVYLSVSEVKKLGEHTCFADSGAVHNLFTVFLYQFAFLM